VNGNGYGTHVDPDNVSGALGSARRLRLALNVLWDGLDEEAGVPGVITKGPQAANDFITQMEEAALTWFGCAEHYLIARPLSLASPPPPELMGKIGGAVRVLAECGLLVGQDDAGPRNYGVKRNEEA
jgi:hypothetical protein